MFITYNYHKVRERPVGLNLISCFQLSIKNGTTEVEDEMEPFQYVHAMSLQTEVFIYQQENFVLIRITFGEHRGLISCQALSFHKGIKEYLLYSQLLVMRTG